MTTVEVSRPDDLGPALREVRLAEEISQSALAQLAAVGRQWLNAFELGEKPSAPLDMVMRVAAALDTQVRLTAPVPAQSNPIDDGDPIDLDEVLARVSR